MFKDIQVKNNCYENLSLWDSHDVQLVRTDGNNGEIVIHPCHIGSLSVRFAKEPYECKIFLAGTKNPIQVQLWEESDWGEIDITDHKKPKWGNDVDGYKTIKRVELLDGYPHGTEIPLEEFSRDVNDFMIYFES